jgi:hypothetical protein
LGTCGSSERFSNDLANYEDIGVNANKRPVSVTILACIYVTVGIVGFAYHLYPVVGGHGFHRDDLLIELIEFAAILGGTFMLRGNNWARWLVLAWIGFHLVISFFDSPQKVAAHGLMFVLTAYFLFRREAKAYFQRPEEVGN